MKNDFFVQIWHKSWPLHSFWLIFFFQKKWLDFCAKRFRMHTTPKPSYKLNALEFLQPVTRWFASMELLSHMISDVFFWYLFMINAVPAGHQWSYISRKSSYIWPSCLSLQRNASGENKYGEMRRSYFKCVQ